MARFSFPNLCSHCGECSPDREWSISRGERRGNWQTTYSIGVPVCNGCASSLRARRAASWVGAFLLALIVFSFVQGGFGGSVIAGLLGGAVTFFFGGLVISRLAGVYFASIGRGGETLHFTNRKYQAAFNRMNLTNLVL